MDGCFLVFPSVLFFSSPFRRAVVAVDSGRNRQTGEDGWSPGWTRPMDHRRCSFKHNQAQSSVMKAG